MKHHHFALLSATKLQRDICIPLLGASFVFLSGLACQVFAAITKESPAPIVHAENSTDLPVTLPEIYGFYLDQIDLPNDIDARVRFFLIELMTDEEHNLALSPEHAKLVRDHLVRHWAHLMGDAKLEFLTSNHMEFMDRDLSPSERERTIARLNEQLQKQTEEHRRTQWILAPHHSLTIRQNVIGAIKYLTDEALTERRELIAQQANQLTDWYADHIEDRLRPIIQVETAWEGPRGIQTSIDHAVEQLNLYLNDPFIASFRRPLTDRQYLQLIARITVQSDQIFQDRLDHIQSNSYWSALESMHIASGIHDTDLQAARNDGDAHFSLLDFDQAPLKQLLDIDGLSPENLAPADFAAFYAMQTFGRFYADSLGSQLLYNAGRLPHRLDGIERDPVVFPLEPRPSRNSWGFIAGMRLEMTFLDPRYKHLGQQRHMPFERDTDGPVPDWSVPFRPDTRLDPSAPLGPEHIPGDSPTATRHDLGQH